MPARHGVSILVVLAQSTPSERRCASPTSRASQRSCRHHRPQGDQPLTACPRRCGTGREPRGRAQRSATSRRGTRSQRNVPQAPRTTRGMRVRRRRQAAVSRTDRSAGPTHEKEPRPKAEAPLHLRSTALMHRWLATPATSTLLAAATSLLVRIRVVVGEVERRLRRTTCSRSGQDRLIACIGSQIPKVV